MSGLSKQERNAIAALKQLAEKWPDTLILFSWSGSLCVVSRDDGEVIAEIHGIPNGGGDPNNEIINGISYLRQ
jgi:hypothetical protein